METTQFLRSNKMLLSCFVLYAVFLFTFSPVDGAMLRTGLTIPKVFCGAGSRCENDSLCINHLNLTTGCYEKLCIPQENLTDVTCDTLNCHQNYECKACSSDSLECGALSVECVLEKHRTCSTLKCDDDFQCKQQKPIPGRGPTCRARLASNTYLCKREVNHQSHQRTSEGK